MNQPETPSRVSRTRWRWLTCFALLLLLASLRLPWLAADSGNSVFWSFAYFSYDEAAYTSGGRLASLTGRFLDPDLSEPHTFGSGWGMHFLAYLGYRLDGLTLGAMRWPSLVLAIAAWLAVYRLLCRRTPPLLAGLLVALVSCNPVSLTYERTASTDVAVAALTILAFALVTARRPVWSVGAGAFVALACCIKANAVVLIPLVALGGWTAPRHRGRRLTVLGLAFTLALGALWLGRQHAVRAASDGRDPALVLAESSRWQYSILNLHYRPTDWLKPISVFPRWPNSLLLGPFVLWALAWPAWWWALFWRRTGRCWTRQHVVPAAMLIYCGALAAQPNNAVRHYLPLLFLVPLLLARSRWLVRPWRAPGGGRRRSPAVLVLVAMIGVLSALYWCQTQRGATPEKVRQIAYNEVTVPHNAWPISRLRMVAGWLLVTAAIGWGLRRRALPSPEPQARRLSSPEQSRVCGSVEGRIETPAPGSRYAASPPHDRPRCDDSTGGAGPGNRPGASHPLASWLFAAAIALVFVWLFFANYTISLLNIDAEFVIDQVLLQCALGLALVILVFPPAAPRPWRWWYLAQMFLLLLFMAGHRHWSQGYGELGTRTWFTRAASRQLAAALPADAVVIGRRASTLLRAVPVRLGMCTLYPPAEFLNKVDLLLAAEPAPPVFWLVDGDDDLQWERCRDLVRQRWGVSYVTTVEIPSGDLLRLRELEEELPLVRIHLLRIGSPAAARND